MAKFDIGAFTDERIAKKQLSVTEIAMLERRVLELFQEKARASNSAIVYLTDYDEYRRLSIDGKHMSEESKKWYVLVDKETFAPVDVIPILIKTLDTDEGLAYSKLVFSV